MTNSKQQVGRWGENRAAKYLEKQGYRIVERNVYTPYGEIDLIAHVVDEGELYLVFVEVKTRTSLTYGHPEDAVTRQKQEHLLAAVQSYLQDHPDLDHPWQVDVIAIENFSPGKAPQIQHFENIIR